MAKKQMNKSGSADLLPVHHTGRHDSNTGVERVVRALDVALVDTPRSSLCQFAGALGERQLSGPRSLAEPSETGEPRHLTYMDAHTRHDASG
jgi:hypothetical protein